MTLQELKNKATAAELCLIDRVEGLIVTEIEKRVTAKVLSFMRANPPPSRDDVRFEPDIIKRWLTAIEKHMSDEQAPEEAQR